MKSDENYYLNDKNKHLKFCRTLIKGGSQALNAYGDHEFAEDFRKEVPGEFELLLPHIPYVGGKEPWTRQLILTAWFIAVYNWMKKNNESIEDIWKLCSDMLEVRLRNIPKPMRRMMRNSVFSDKQKKTYSRQAEEFRKKIYPEGDVFNYIEMQDGFEKCDFCLLKNGIADVYSSVWNDSWNHVN